MLPGAETGILAQTLEADPAAYESERHATLITIRPASSDDAPSIASLITSLGKKFITCDFGSEGKVNFLSSVEESAIRRLLSEDNGYFVAEAADRIVGAVGIRSRTHLFHLFVAEPFQGTGLGRKLWFHAREEVVSSNYEGALTVNSSRNAVSFYEKLGFVQDGGLDERGGVVAIPMSLAVHPA